MTAGRRRLIVVSNRGPVSFSRDASGNRFARRGGGGLVTALRSLVSHHDVTWVASAISAEDRAVAAEAGDEAIAETARDGSPYRLRFVVSDPNAYDWYYNVVSNPTLWFVQHYLWNLVYQPALDQGLHHAWNDGYEPRRRLRRASGKRGLSDSRPGAAPSASGAPTLPSRQCQPGI